MFDRCDLLVVGGGGAALRAAIAAHEVAPDLSIVLVTKGTLGLDAGGELVYYLYIAGIGDHIPQVDGFRRIIPGLIGPQGDPDRPYVH